MSYWSASRSKKILLLPVVVILILASCVKDNFELEKLSEKVSYRPSFVVPLAHGNLTLGNFLKPDDTLIFVEPDNTIRLVLREEAIFSVSADDLLKIPLPDPVFISLSTPPVELADFNTTTGIDLSETVNRINEPESSYILESEGNTVSFPSIPVQYIGDITARLPEDIEYAYFAAGDLELTVHNNFPAEVNMVLRLVNESDRSEIAGFSFAGIGPGESVSLISGLEDKVIRSSFVMEIMEFSTASSEGEVYIDLSDEIVFEINARDLLASKGRARIERTLLDSGEALRDLPFASDVQLDELTMGDGQIHYISEHFPEGVTLSVTIDNVYHEERPVSFDITPEPDGALSGTHNLIDVDFDFSEYDKQMFFSYRLFAGSENREMVEFDFSLGSIDMDLRGSDFNASYASGYFGREELSLDIDKVNLDFDLYDRLSGEFRLTNPYVSFFYDNSAGVPIELLVNMDATSDEGNSVGLFDAEQREFAIDYPDEPYDSVAGEILIDKETSNIVELIALPPSAINIDASVIMNPDGPGTGQNIVTTDSRAEFGVEFVLPLEMQLTNLGFADTVEIDIETEEYDMVELLLLTLRVNNGFPLGASVDLSLYDSKADQVLHSFGDVMLTEAATVDEEGFVIEGGEATSEAEVEVTGDILDALNRADHVIVSARLNTGKHNGSQVPVKFQTTNSLNFRIKIRADVNINNQAI